MSDLFSQTGETSPDPEVILDFGQPSARVAFPTENLEVSIPARFAKIVERYPDRLAVKMGEHS